MEGTREGFGLFGGLPRDWFEVFRELRQHYVVFVEDARQEHTLLERIREHDVQYHRQVSRHSLEI